MKQLWSGVVLCIAIGNIVAAQQPGELPPSPVPQQLRKLGQELAAHMNQGDAAAVEKTVSQIRKTLGPYAGVPESKVEYISPLEPTPPALDEVRSHWRQAYESLQDSVGARSSFAKKNEGELRESAYVAFMCSMALQAGMGDREALEKRIREEADYLLARQAPNGLFPYPAKPGGRTPANVRAMVERLRNDNPEAIRNGYLYLDIPDMQFDVGCCGVAMCEAYRITQDPKYLASAEGAAQWAMEIPLAANWNYNAFSVWLLANVYALTGKSAYLETAVRKSTLGVLPGLMETGRWVDQHNAKQSYHFIMVRALSDLAHVMPADHPDRTRIAEALTLAGDTRAREILRDGVSNTESAFWGLSEFVRNQGPGKARVDALNAIANALLQRQNALNALFLPVYVLARQEVQDSHKAMESHPLDTVLRGIALLNANTWRGQMAAEQHQRAGKLAKDLEAAMNARNMESIRDTVEELVEVHGDYAGVPETPPEYGAPINQDTPDFDHLVALWEKSFHRLKGRYAFQVAPPAQGETQPGHRLRVTVRHCRAFLHAYEAGIPPHEEYLAYAREGFDYLLKTQASTGVFGYPYDPAGSGLKASAARIVEQGRQRGLTMVENGWIIEDLGEGGLQFDNGMVGVSLLYAYSLTGDGRYLDAARRAGEWAIKRPLVANWNYNSFSGWLLARLYRITGEKGYLDAARVKFDCGVLPGQLDSGRWFDQHNAKIQYHSTMLRALVEFFLALKESDGAQSDALREKIVLGLDSLALQITTYGASNASEYLSTDALCMGLFALGPNELWERALNVNVNYLCDHFLAQLEAHSYPMTETTTEYILYRAVQQDAAVATESQPGLGRPAA